MKLRWIVSIALVAGLAGLWAGASLAEEDEMSEEEMMKKMMELGQPGPHHKHLETFVGEWDGASTFWMQGKEEKGKGSSTVKWVKGKRFLHITWSGPFMNMTYEGEGYMGHNNFKKQYEMIWLDNMSSGIDMKTGTASEDGKTITFTGTWESPMGSFPVRHVFQVNGPDTYTMTGYSTYGENEVKEMEIVYTRKK